MCVVVRQWVGRCDTMGVWEGDNGWVGVRQWVFGRETMGVYV